MDFLSMVIGYVFLTLISIIDFKTYNIKKGYIPSIITTLFLVLSFMVGGEEALFSGVFASLIGLLLTDLDFWGGIADFKVFVASAMLFDSFIQVSIFAGILTLVGFMFKTIMLGKLKDQNAKVPFIPVILVAWASALFFSF